MLLSTYSRTPSRFQVKNKQRGRFVIQTRLAYSEIDLAKRQFLISIINQKKNTNSKNVFITDGVAKTFSNRWQK